MNVPARDTDVEFWFARFQEHASLLNDLLLPEQKFKSYRTIRDLKTIQRLIHFQETLLLYIEDNRPIFDPRYSNIDIRSLIHHMIEEEKYLLAIVDGQMDIRDEIYFWLHENSEHTDLAGRLFKPEFRKQQIETLMLSDSIDQLSKDLNYVIETLERSNIQAKKSLENLILNPEMSLLTVDMLNHEIQETDHGIDRLIYLNSQL